MPTEKALFLDRDGVLNIDTGYTHLVEDLTMVDGAVEAVRIAHDLGYKVFIVTNQGGIGLGMYDEAAMDQFHSALLEKIHSGGGVITAIAFCPHHPEAIDQNMRDCHCRKPSPKMILKLAETHLIDLSQSLMIGDRESDVMAGEAAGCSGHLFRGGRLDDFIAPLLEARS